MNNKSGLIIKMMRRERMSKNRKIFKKGMRERIEIRENGFVTF
jgi:hypothetical protein